MTWKPLTWGSMNTRARMAWLADTARAAAKRGDFKTNHRLCREHDDIALENPSPLPRAEDAPVSQGSLTKRWGKTP